ncbi:pulmonary surfactant-associated protein B-like [Anas acuta]|uniref:pulmonary surfactant-associated protein B-like n=1 Tax=Anas acuta TaxID=28680 RepID=UPI0035C9377A
MASLLLALLPAVTALVLVGAESPPLSHQTLPAGDTEDGPWLQLGDKDSTGGGGQLSRSWRCNVCQNIVKILSKMVKDIKDKYKVTRATQHVCDTSPKSQCKQWLQKWLNRIVDALVHHKAPKRICTILALCP